MNPEAPVTAMHALGLQTILCNCLETSAYRPDLRPKPISCDYYRRVWSLLLSPRTVYSLASPQLSGTLIRNQFDLELPHCGGSEHRRPKRRASWLERTELASLLCIAWRLSVSS